MASNRLKMSLLPALKAILDTGSVTRAAEQMHVTQSTMSRTLSQLREALNDPVLVREGNHIYLSEKARGMQPMVSRLLADSETLFESQHFDPATSEHSFRLACGTVILQYFLVDTLLEVGQSAPGVSVEVIPTHQRTVEAMAAGELDLGVFVTLPGTGSELRRETICESTFYLLVRKGHPLCKGEGVTIQEVEPFPYVETHSVIASDPYISSIRERVKPLMNPWLRLPSTQSTLDIVERSDAFAISTGIEYKLMSLDDRFEILPFLPVMPNRPKISLEVAWPDHWEFNQAHQWLREGVISRLKAVFVDF